ncbi:MAG: hypothetical protein V1645_04105 [archaeon]
MGDKDKLYNIEVPWEDSLSFQAKIKDEKAGLGEIVDELVRTIQFTPKLHYGHLMNWDSRIPYANKEIDEKNKVAAFILLREQPYIVIMEGRGMKWFEAIYGVRIDGEKLKGKIIDWGWGDHGPDGDHGTHYRFTLNKIEEGILKYTQQKRTGFTWKEYWGGLGKEVCTETKPFEKELDLKKID